jgi:hypothetical protein
MVGSMEEERNISCPNAGNGSKDPTFSGFSTVFTAIRIRDSQLDADLRVL